MGKINEDLVTITGRYYDSESYYVYDYILKGGNIPITDYSRFKKKAFWVSDDNNIELLDKDFIEITSIEELENVLMLLIQNVVTTLRTFAPKFKTEQVDYRNFKEIKELLIEQLVFDILRDKYLNEEKVLNRYQYATYICKKIYGVEGDEDVGLANIRAVYENITGGMEKHSELMLYSKLRDQLKFLGIDIDKYYNSKVADSSEKKRTLHEWNDYHFNFGINMKDTFDASIMNNRGTVSLTARQYRRQVDGKGEKFNYNNFFRDVKKYCEVIEKFLPDENEDDKTYFEKTMEYFFIESYKRIDYMFKIVEYVPEDVLAVYKERVLENFWGLTYRQNFFLCESFCPPVAVLFEDNGNVEYGTRNNYYRPLIKIEEAIMEECMLDNWKRIDYFKDLLQKHYFVRAKVYELFHYYYAFKSDDYSDIKKYLQEKYNMSSYHKTTGVWDVIKKYNNWDELDKKGKKAMRKKLRCFKTVNNFFFADSKYRHVKK